MSFKNFFQKIEKTIDDVIFSVSVSVLVSNFAGLGLEAKIEIETGLGLGLGLGKILWSRSRSWSRTSRSRLQPWLKALPADPHSHGSWGLGPQTPVCDTFEYTWLLNTSPTLDICTF